MRSQLALTSSERSGLDGSRVIHAVVCQSRRERRLRCGRAFYDASFGKEGKEWRFKGTEGDLLVPVSGNLETNSAEALRAAALLGQGLFLAPSLLVASELKSGVLVPLLAEFLPEEYSLDALYPHRDHLPAKVRSFIDLIVRDCCDAMAYPAQTQRRKAALS